MQVQLQGLSQDCATPAKEGTLRSYPHIYPSGQAGTARLRRRSARCLALHIISFDQQAGTTKNQARSAYGDGESWLMRRFTELIHVRL